AVALLAAPGAAQAVLLAPPGKAGADQYFESIPTAAGNVEPPQGGVKPPAQAAPAGSVAAAAQAGAHALSSLGADGRAAALIVTASAPVNASATREKLAVPAHGSTPATTPTTAAGSGDPVGGVLDALTGSDAGGIGALMPILMLAGLIAA